MICSQVKFLYYSMNDAPQHNLLISFFTPVHRSISSHILLKSSSAPPLFIPPLKAVHTRQLFTIETCTHARWRSCCVTIQANVAVHRSHKDRRTQSVFCVTKQQYTKLTLHASRGMFVGQSRRNWSLHCSWTGNICALYFHKCKCNL